jgi:hypothetical protein
MARVKVYERPTPEIKYVDGTLMQNWMIQWRDDETRGAANPQTYEWRRVPSTVSDTSQDRTTQ